jgi:four helix bundle protein
MRAYRVACELVEEAWQDAEKLRHHGATEKISGQLYAAVGSIAANLGEGYSHSSGRERARIFEYALGSTRESMVWFQSAQPVLGAAVVPQPTQQTRRNTSTPARNNSSGTRKANQAFTTLSS